MGALDLIQEITQIEDIFSLPEIKNLSVILFSNLDVWLN